MHQHWSDRKTMTWRPVLGNKNEKGHASNWWEIIVAKVFNLMLNSILHKWTRWVDLNTKWMHALRDLFATHWSLRLKQEQPLQVRHMMKAWGKCDCALSCWYNAQPLRNPRIKKNQSFQSDHLPKSCKQLQELFLTRNAVWRHLWTCECQGCCRPLRLKYDDTHAASAQATNQGQAP